MIRIPESIVVCLTDNRGKKIRKIVSGQTMHNFVECDKFVLIFSSLERLTTKFTGPRSAVGNVSGYRCVSDCRSRGREFDPGPVPYFCGD